MSLGNAQVATSVPYNPLESYTDLRKLTHNHLSRPNSWKWGREVTGRVVTTECLRCGNIWFIPESLVAASPLLDLRCSCGEVELVLLEGLGDDHSTPLRPIELPGFKRSTPHKRGERRKGPKIRETRKSPRTPPSRKKETKWRPEF